jgi:hypothetical protein
MRFSGSSCDWREPSTRWARMYCRTFRSLPSPAEAATPGAEAPSFARRSNAAITGPWATSLPVPCHASNCARQASGTEAGSWRYRS